MQGSFAEIPENVVVNQVGQRGHICGQFVCQFVQRAYDEAALTIAQASQLLIQLAVELIIIRALPWYPTVTARAWLIGEHHASKSTVEELVLVEVTC